MSLQWQGHNQMMARVLEYERRIKFAVRQVALRYQAIFEAYAKENAPWADRTGNARQSLHSFVEELSNDTVRLYLSHGVDYGIFLETRFAGKYQIIWPTIHRHLPQIRQMLQEIFA